MFLLIGILVCKVQADAVVGDNCQPPRHVDRELISALHPFHVIMSLDIKRIIVIQNQNSIIVYRSEFIPSILDRILHCTVHCTVTNSWSMKVFNKKSPETKTKYTASSSDCNCRGLRSHDLLFSLYSCYGHTVIA